MLNPDQAYKPELRLTGRRGFGDSLSSNSFKGSDPEQLLASAESKLSDYRSCVELLDSGRPDSSQRREESQQLRAFIKDQLTAADQEIKAKQALGAKDFVIKRLKTVLDNHLKTFEQLIQTEKERMEDGQEESNFDSFTGSDRDTIGEGEGDTLAQEALQVNDSALGIREKQAEEVLGLERDIADLHDISKNLNEMIVEQGQDVDRIELHTEKAANRTEKATANTTAAVALSRQNRTLLIIILAIGGGVVLVILIVVIVLAVVLSRN